MLKTGLEKLTILHFNDVYNLEEGQVEPVGGVARFKIALESFSHLEPLILFSGDLFQPSLMGTMYNGEQMIRPINDFNVDVACFGNHEFDLEIDMLTGFIHRTNFPWLLSNVKDVNTKLPLCGGKEYHVLTKHGLKIGFVGLAEEDWLHVVNSIEEEDIIFEDYIACAQRLTKILKEEHKCDLIIALTHMRTYNDKILAEKFTEFDLILGGHDHVNFAEEVNGTYIIKSGSDFREFNKITLTLPNSRFQRSTNEQSNANGNGIENQKTTETSHEKCGVSVETIYVTKDFKPDHELKAHTDYYLDLFQESMKLPLGFALCELETRFDKIRNSEQNFPNFIADIIREETESDCALVNCGTFRSNLLFKEGLMTMGDLRLILPYADLILQMELTGEQLYRALENGVSKYPALEGRFPAVSGISFEFDPKKEPMKRITFDSIRIRGGPLKLDERYTLAGKKWILEGKDGYDMFTEAKVISDIGVAEELHSIIKRFFELGHDIHFVDLFKAEKEGAKSPSHGKICHKKLHFYEKLKHLIHDIAVHDGCQYVGIKPQVEGRVKILS